MHMSEGMFSDVEAQIFEENKDKNRHIFAILIYFSS